MSAAPNITCPSCTKVFKGKPELVGKTIRCPSCKEVFIVPGVEDVQESDILTATSAAKTSDGEQPGGAFSFQEGDGQKGAAAAKDDDEGAYGVTDLDIAPRCPNCANELESENAVVCLFCGYNLQTRQWGQTKKTYATTSRDWIMHIVPGVIYVILVIGVIFGNLFYCLVFPYMIDPTSWVAWFDHESVKLWLVILDLAILWTAGQFLYQRLIIEPAPEEAEKR